MLSKKKTLEHSSTAFRTLVKSLENCNIRKKILEICSMRFSTENEWNSILNTIYTDFTEYIDLKKIGDTSFVAWKGKDLLKNEEVKTVNKKEYIDEDTGRIVELQFGSIHSSKGRTHLSTLIVETKYHEYNLESILPWLTGRSKKLGKRNKQRLKCQYVAMTRAKGLICLAMKRDSISEETRKELCDFGWCVEEL